MNGVTSFSISFALAVLAVTPTNAFAGEWDNKCRQEGQKQSQECQNAVNQAGGADAASAAQKAATTGASANINPGTGAQGAQIAEQTARLQSAKARCEAAKKQCESKCDSEKGKAQPIAKDTTNPRNGEAKGDVGTIDGTKNSTCIAPIMGMIGQLDNGLSQLAQAQQGTGNTGNSSGAMPPIPPPSNKDDEKKNNATDTANQNQPLDCKQSQNTRYSDCNDYYINKCSGNMGQDGCDQFINRYCGPMNGSGTSTTTNQVSNFSISSTSATANLVADKQGEGMGSSFCGKANGYRFCQTSGREQCPSCQSLTNWSTSLSTDQLKQAQNTCPSDPMFADPAIAAQLNNNSNGSATDNPATSTLEGPLPSGNNQLANATNFSTGAPAASSGAGSNAGRASLGKEAGIAEGTAVGGGSIDLNSGTGGGSSWHGDDEEHNSGHKIGLQSATGPRAPAGQLVSKATDVANQFGPNIFSISTSTYRALCTRGRFLHCRER
jgi:hypothetical protein